MSGGAKDPRGASPAIAPDDRFAPAARVRFQRAGDELVLLHLDRGVYFRINATGLEVWTRLASGARVEEICAALSRTFAVEPEVAYEETSALLVALLGQGLVERLPAPPERA